MEKKNSSKLLSNDNNVPPVASRPKVVLVNPNFQRKQMLPGKTIHLNPLFRPTAALSKQVYLSNHTASSSSSNSEDELVQTCNNASCASLITSIQNLKSVDKNLKTFEMTCSFRNCLLSKSTNDTNDEAVASNFSSSYFKPSNDVASAVSKIKSQSMVCQQCMGPNICQPKKTYVNPKFLKPHKNTDNFVQKKASFFYVNVKKLKIESETRGIKDSGSFDQKLTYSCVDRDGKVHSLVAEGSAGNGVKQTIPNENTPRSLTNSDPPEKASIDSYPATCATTSTCSSALSSSSALKSIQNKKMDLLRLQKITRLAQLAQISRLRKKNIKSNPQVKYVAHSTKYKFKQFSSKSLSYIQNYVPQIKNNFSRHNVPFLRQSISQKYRNEKDQHSTFQQQSSAPQKCSKFKLVKPEVHKYHLILKHSVNKSQSRPINNSMPSDQSISKSNHMRSRNLVGFNLRKFVKVNERYPQQSFSENFNSTKQDPASVMKIKENICSQDIPSTSQKLLSASNKKLIRKLPTKKDSHQTNRSYISKNKYILRNINLVRSKNYAACLKINFKPSRTSSDVINKRIVQRKVINRCKLLNIQQNLNKAENSNASVVATVKSLRRDSKCTSSEKERRNSVIRNKNSSFISIGKTKLIRKSVLNQKLRSRRNKTNNLKQINAASSKYSNKTNLQSLSAKSTEKSRNVKTFNNDLIAIGRTKLVKRSSLRWRKQVNELKTKRNNVAAVSVIQKQLNKLCKSLPENHQNMKLLKKVSASKQNSKTLLSNVKKKLLTKRRIALRCKNNIPCETFHRYGRCKKFILGKCFKLHDKKYVGMCQAFIRGACKSEACLLSHEIVPQKMPTCHHFLQGACSRDDCLYPHVKLSAKAPICRDFARGFCSLGLDCDKLHVLMCPESEKKGFCTNRPNCKFVHRKKKKPQNKSFGENETSNSVATEQSSKTENALNLEAERNNEPTKRYFSKDSEKELESYIPKRPQLGSLPSFIPLNSCDTKIKN